jgi:hypothetical protein
MRGGEFSKKQKELSGHVVLEFEYVKHVTYQACKS